MNGILRCRLHLKRIQPCHAWKGLLENLLGLDLYAFGFKAERSGGAHQRVVRIRRRKLLEQQLSGKWQTVERTQSAYSPYEIFSGQHSMRCIARCHSACFLTSRWCFAGALHRMHAVLNPITARMPNLLSSAKSFISCPYDTR